MTLDDDINYGKLWQRGDSNATLVAQQFQETGFSVSYDRDGRCYVATPTEQSINYGSFQIQNRGDNVRVCVRSGRVDCKDLAVDMLRDAGVKGIVEYK